VPTLVQEAKPGAKTVEQQREELATLPPEVLLSPEEVAEIRAIGDNTGSMTLKGGVPDHDGDALPDRWHLDDELEAVGRRWSIDPRGLQPA
jgi:hypothetical protein